MIVRRVFKPEAASHNELANILGNLILDSRENSHIDAMRMMDIDSFRGRILQPATEEDTNAKYH